MLNSILEILAKCIFKLLIKYRWKMGITLVNHKLMKRVKMEDVIGMNETWGLQIQKDE